MKRLPVMTDRLRRAYRRLVLLDSCPSLISGDAEGDVEAYTELGIIGLARLTQNRWGLSEDGRKLGTYSVGMKLGRRKRK